MAAQNGNQDLIFFFFFFSLGRLFWSGLYRVRCQLEIPCFIEKVRHFRVLGGCFIPLSFPLVFSHLISREGSARRVHADVLRIKVQMMKFHKLWK